MSKLAFVFPGQGAQAAGHGQGPGRRLPRGARRVRGGRRRPRRAALPPLLRGAGGGAQAHRQHPAGHPGGVGRGRGGAGRARRAARPGGRPLARRVLGAGGSGRHRRRPSAARAVRARGTFMQEAVPAGQGAMAAVLGLDPERVRAICEAAQAATGHVCSPANYNEPAQTVIAGDAAAVERASNDLKAAGAKRVVPLAVSAPFHCALMEPVRARLEPVLAALPWRAPARAGGHQRGGEGQRRPRPHRAAPGGAGDRAGALDRVCAGAGAAGRHPLRRGGPGKGALRAGEADRQVGVEVFNVADPASLEKTLAALQGAR